MSAESYLIEGVTITPHGGGFYELTHSTLTVPERVRGKDAAEARAREIFAAAQQAAQDDGRIPEQPPIDAAIAAAPLVAQDLAEAEVQPAPAPAPVSDPIAQMQQMILQQQVMINTLLARVPTTVGTLGDEAPVRDPRSIMPTEYRGKVTDDRREAAKAIGVEYVTIELADHSDIPPTGLFLSHNGRGYMITPGEPVDVPDYLLGILDDAVQSTPIVDGKTQKVIGWRNQSKYPYRRL